MSKLLKIVQIIKNCQKFSKLSKIVKIVKIVENCQKMSTIVKIVKMLVRLCFLITLIKCLKGHKSLGSLCNVKSKSTLSEWVTRWVTRSPIELLWSAKKPFFFPLKRSTTLPNWPYWPISRLSWSCPSPSPEILLKLYPLEEGGSRRVRAYEISFSFS